MLEGFRGSRQGAEGLHTHTHLNLKPPKLEANFFLLQGLLGTVRV